MKRIVGRLAIILGLLVIIIGGGVIALTVRKDSLAHVYLERFSGKQASESSTTQVATQTDTDSSTINATKLNAQLKHAHFVGNVAVIKAGKLVYQQPYGQDPKKDTKTAATRYQIGSLQNALTAAAVMKLAKDGKLDLSTPVSKYYLLDNADASVTVGTLLDMISGLTLSATPSSELNANVLPWNLANATVATPGTYNFQTVNYAILSGIIAQASGESYQKYLKQTILVPAGVKHTSFVTSATAQAKVVPSFTYDKTSDSSSAVTQATLFQAMNDQLGAKQLATTAGDMATLTQYITSSRFVSEERRSQGIVAKADTAYTGRLMQANSDLLARADFSGYHNALAFNERGDTGVVLLSNYQKAGSLSDTARAILKIVQKND